MSDPARLVFLYVVPLVVLWAALLIDLIRRSDISLIKKMVWGIFTFVTAEFGAIVYIAMRPLRYPEDGVSSQSQNETVERLLNVLDSEDSETMASAKQDAIEAIR